MIASIELWAFHYTGGLLLGSYPCPDSVPNGVTEDRLRRVVEATIAVRCVDQTWPIDVRRVVDVLAHLGVFEEIGGEAFLLDLIETWCERIERARMLGSIEAWARIALAHLEDELAAGDMLATAIERRERARTEVNDAIAAMVAAEEEAQAA